MMDALYEWNAERARLQTKIRELEAEGLRQLEGWALAAKDVVRLGGELMDMRVYLLIEWFGMEMRVLGVYSSHARAEIIADLCQGIADAEAEETRKRWEDRYPDLQPVKEQLFVREMKVK